MIPPLHYYGVPQNIINQMVAWAQTMWPKENWSPLSTATCVAADAGTPNSVYCSTDHSFR